MSIRKRSTKKEIAIRAKIRELLQEANIASMTDLQMDLKCHMENVTIILSIV